VLTGVTAALQHRLSYGGSPHAPPHGVFLRAALLTGTLPFVTIAVAAQALVARARAHERELDAARAQGQLAEARLAVLTAQLQPHFLFNTLQAISTLITHDPAAADRMLTSLRDLLREVLRRGDRREVALDEELRVLEAYLDISRARFGERLSVSVDASADARRGLVPFFVLQPLVENALHHGVSSRAGPASVRIDATRDDGRLWLTVTDDGPAPATPSPRGGIGLPNTRARLQQLYGDAHVLDVGPLAAGGFRVRVGIPYRPSPAGS
jgi:LytS/YehU family sensor histidine kinase